jgi:hypothetical protein
LSEVPAIFSFTPLKILLWKSVVYNPESFWSVGIRVTKARRRKIYFSIFYFYYYNNKNKN